MDNHKLSPTPENSLNKYKCWFKPELFKRPGTYDCPKSGKIQYHNSYVRKLAFLLDRDQNTLEFFYKKVHYDYYYKGKSKTNRIDFLVKTNTGQKLIQVYPCALIDAPLVQARMRGIRKKAKQKQIPVEFWTEIDLFGCDPLYTESLIRYLY